MKPVPSRPKRAWGESSQEAPVPISAENVSGGGGSPVAAIAIGSRRA